MPKLAEHVLDDAKVYGGKQTMGSTLNTLEQVLQQRFPDWTVVVSEPSKEAANVSVSLVFGDCSSCLTRFKGDVRACSECEGNLIRRFATRKGLFVLRRADVGDSLRQLFQELDSSLVFETMP